MSAIAVPVSRLVLSKSNVRKTERNARLDELVASIAAHGVRQNLNVRAITGGRYEVVAGARRLLALKQLVTDRRLDAEAPVPCLVLRDDDDPAEISLVENAVRRTMHPDDQCAAFQGLIEQQQLSADDIAARFGVTPAVVRQRLKLAAVSPKLRALYRRGELTLAHMTAFALVDDHAAQEATYAELPEWDRSPEAIRRILTRSAVQVTHKLARFVGLDAYENAGGSVVRDLFGGDDQSFMTDAVLLERLATERLETAAAAIRQEGWKWVAVELAPDYGTSYSRVYPVAEVGDAPAFTAGDLARAGARLTIGSDGELQVERGLVAREELRRERARSRSTDERVDHHGAVRLPDTVVEELTAHRTAAIRVELSRRPEVALATVVHALALSTLYPRLFEVGSPIAITVVHVSLERHAADSEDGLAHHVLADEHATWLARLPVNAADLWAWCFGETQEVLLQLLAFVVALSSNAVRTKLDPPSSPRHGETRRTGSRSHRPSGCRGCG